MDWTNKEIFLVMKIFLAEENNTAESEAMKWRTDSHDGLRPLCEYRKELLWH